MLRNDFFDGRGIYRVASGGDRVVFDGAGGACTRMARAAEQAPERKGQHHSKVVSPWLLDQGGFHGDTPLVEQPTLAAENGKPSCTGTACKWAMVGEVAGMRIQTFTSATASVRTATGRRTF